MTPTCNEAKIKKRVVRDGQEDINEERERKSVWYTNLAFLELFKQCSSNSDSATTSD